MKSYEMGVNVLVSETQKKNGRDPSVLNEACALKVGQMVCKVYLF